VIKPATDLVTKHIAIDAGLIWRQPRHCHISCSDIHNVNITRCCWRSCTHTQTHTHMLLQMYTAL